MTDGEGADERPPAAGDKAPPRRYLWISVLALCGAALLIAGVRLGLPYWVETPMGGDTAWRLTWSIGLDTSEPGATLTVAVPHDTAHVSVYSQELNHPGLHIKRSPRQRAGRALSVVAKQPGRYRFEAVHGLYLHADPVNHAPRRERLGAGDRQRYLDTTKNAAILAEFSNFVEFAGENVDDQDALVGVIFDTVQHWAGAPGGAHTSAATLDLARARAMVALCRSNFLPARLVTGVELGERADAALQYWVEVWRDDRWIAFDPGDGRARVLPATYVPISWNTHEIVHLAGAGEIESRLVVWRQGIPPGLFGHEARLIDVLDLERLPLADRATLELLMMLPFGALITTFLRQVAGMRSYGTFAPILLAFSASLGDWVTLSIVFSIVVVFSIAGRAMMPGLELKRLPRLGIVFTLVSVSMGFSVSLMEYFDHDPGDAVMLLPMVVLTILVDSAYRTLDQYGMRTALMRLLWTAVVGLITLSLFVQEQVGAFAVSHPEVHLITVALIIVTGKYRGPRLIKSYVESRDATADATPGPG